MSRPAYLTPSICCGAALLTFGLACSAAVAREATDDGPIQNVATSVRPSPGRARADRSQAYADGCLVTKPATRSPACVYGDRRSRTTVVLFGDSHALQYFPPVRRVADRRGWRLVALTKSGCPPSDVDVYYRHGHRRFTECGKWRRAMLRRIQRKEAPAVVVMTGSNYTAVMKGGKVLSRQQGRPLLARGTAAVAKRLVADGAHVVAIRDLPAPPWDIPSCVARSMRHLRRCAFSKRSALPHPDPVSAALRRVDGVRLIDPSTQLCVGSLCPAVSDDLLVYRQLGHLTATFAATLAPWLRHELRDLP